MTSAKLWGEISSDVVEDPPDVTSDIERSMSQFFLKEFEGEDNTKKVEQIMLPPMDPLMIYSIALHKHAKALIQMSPNNEHSEELDTNMPEAPQIDRRHKKNNLNYVPKEFTDFTLGHDLETPELSKEIVHQILTKCIATMFAHIGYESSEESALNVLTDVLEDFFMKLLHHFKVAEKDENVHLPSGFPHTIEKVFTELGLGGVKGLNDYYQTRVINYVTVLQSRCKDLNQAHSEPKSPVPVDKINKMVRVKVEQEDVVEVDNREVHFSTIEGDVNYSILATGYQLLNSLEAEADLQNFGEGEEDIVVTESPGVASETDLSHLSPYSKKERFK